MYSPQEFSEIYSPQFGGALPAYKASYLRQKGAGIGGVFGAIARFLMPYVSKALPIVAQHAKSAIRNIATDVVNSSQPFKVSLKSNAIGALKGIGKDLLDQSGSGLRRRRVKRKRPSKAVKKKTKRRKKQVGRKRKPRKVPRKRKIIRKKSIFDF
jgi:hypothetical protein